MLFSFILVCNVQVYPVVLPVFFTKLLNSPLKDCAVEILLPSLINSKQLPVLCEISFGYDILRKLLTCEGDWVSIESSQQLLYNILRVCVDLLDQSKLEDLTSDKIQYFQLLSNASSKIVNPLLLPCIEKLVLSLIQLLLSTHGKFLLLICHVLKPCRVNTFYTLTLFNCRCTNKCMYVVHTLYKQ
jgi:hypothetical protein